MTFCDVINNYREHVSKSQTLQYVEIAPAGL
jgi:hypothetical protein